MTGQDELAQVGPSLMVEEPVVQDNPIQVDFPPPPNSESVVGAEAAAARERSLQHTSPLPGLWRIGFVWVV